MEGEAGDPIGAACGQWGWNIQYSTRNIQCPSGVRYETGDRLSGLSPVG